LVIGYWGGKVWDGLVIFGLLIKRFIYGNQIIYTLGLLQGVPFVAKEPGSFGKEFPD
jgi:hypothetical protein